jgi:hypothetical protein
VLVRSLLSPWLPPRYAPGHGHLHGSIAARGRSDDPAADPAPTGSFLAHDLGELAGNDQLNRAAHDLTRRFPILAERALPHFTTSRTQATVAIGALAAGVTMLSWRAARSAPHSPTMTAYGAATLLLGAHMVPHTVAAIALRRWHQGWPAA